MKRELLKRIITSIVLAGGILAIMCSSKKAMSVVLLACLIWILCFEWPKIARGYGFMAWLIAPFYLIVPFYALIQISENQLALALIFLLVAACDIGCYLAGNMFGKHLLAPHISPKKTWEGVIGGIFLTITVSYALGLTKLHDITSISLPIALLAIAGDLCESYFKRCAQIKDTGTILPGHGGLLDRFDSLLFVALYYYYFLLS